MGKGFEKPSPGAQTVHRGEDPLVIHLERRVVTYVWESKKFFVVGQENPILGGSGGLGK